MYAIVNIAGQQFKVEKDQQVIVHRLEGEEGKKLEFSDVVLVENAGKGLQFLLVSLVTYVVTKLLSSKRNVVKVIRNKAVTVRI
jgi:ribosomal protein L21